MGAVVQITDLKENTGLCDVQQTNVALDGSRQFFTL